MRELIQFDMTEKCMLLWLEKHNEAFKERSNESIPYIPLSVENIKADEKLYALKDGDELVAGCSLRFIHKYVLIKHVWSDVNKRKKGYASSLLDGVISIARGEGSLFAKLVVAAIYKPAVGLYKKKGFKIYAVNANIPKTFYNYDMVKCINAKDGFFFETKRLFGLAISKIKFFLLFKKDSSPKFLWKILYGKKEDKEYREE